MEKLRALLDKLEKSSGICSSAHSKPELGEDDWGAKEHYCNKSKLEFSLRGSVGKRSLEFLIMLLIYLSVGLI